MSELLPCPICGHDAELVEGWYVYCPNRSCWVDGTALEDTKTKAIEAWNTRYERTCHSIDPVGSEFFICSECNFGAGKIMFTEFYNYCPNCGAKVVSE